VYFDNSLFLRQTSYYLILLVLRVRNVNGYYTVDVRWSTSTLCNFSAVDVRPAKWQHDRRNAADIMYTLNSRLLIAHLASNNASRGSHLPTCGCWATRHDLCGNKTTVKRDILQHPCQATPERGNLELDTGYHLFVFGELCNNYIVNSWWWLLLKIAYVNYYHAGVALPVRV